MLGELTVSMLKGEDGNQRKEFGKLLDWLQSEPPPDVVSLPNSLLIGLAQPIKAALKRPITCTLQGEDLFLEGLPEPYRSESLALIRSQIEHVDSFIAVSEYCAEFMSGYLGIPERKMRVVPLGVNLKGYEPDWKFHTNCFTVGYFARVCPEKGCTRFARPTGIFGRAPNFPAPRSKPPVILAPEHKPYLKKIERQMKDWGLGQEFQYRGVLDRAQKIDFLRNLNVLSGSQLLQRAQGDLPA